MYIDMCGNVCIVYATFTRFQANAVERNIISSSHESYTSNIDIFLSIGYDPGRKFILGEKVN